MKNKASSNGIGCLTVVGIVFIILKLLGMRPVCEWSWLWVLCPFWLPIAVGVGFIVCAAAIILFVGCIFGKN